MIIKTDLSEIENYLVDASNYKGRCEKLCFPITKNDVAQIFREANAGKTNVTITGNRTGLCGGAVPDNGILVSTDKMNKVIEINEVEKYAIVQPGVLLRDFIETVNQKGLYYTPDPTEKDCYIGGNIANNASGAKSFKYGATREHVLALEVILPEGDELFLERGKTFANGYILSLQTKVGRQLEIKLPQYDMPQTKHAAGFYVKENMDAIDLFIGSEGTLGFVSEIKLRLLEKPQNILSSVIFFNKEKDALHFVEEARAISYKNRVEEKDHLDALGLEYFDANALNFLTEDFPNIPADSAAAVWFEQEITSENEDDLFNEWVELIEKCNGDVESAWFANNEKDRKIFGDFRHAIAWKVNEFMAKKDIMKVGTDIAVPDDKFREFYYFAKERVDEKKIHQVAYGHFGNSHLHLNMLPENLEEYKTAKEIYALLCRKGVELKGTISAEHGIGKLKRDYLLMMFGEDGIMKMADLKKQFDPNLILSIGNIIDPRFYEKL